MLLNLIHLYLLYLYKIASLQPLVAVINNPSSRSPENVLATEICISALGKICRYNNSHFNVNEVLPIWFNALPILEDIDEVEQTYEYLYVFFYIIYIILL